MYTNRTKEERKAKYTDLIKNKIKNRNGVIKWEVIKALDNDYMYIILRQRVNYKKAVYCLDTDELKPISTEQYKQLLEAREA